MVIMIVNRFRWNTLTVTVHRRTKSKEIKRQVPAASVQLLCDNFIFPAFEIAFTMIYTVKTYILQTDIKWTFEESAN